mmetsp:Transcript_41086/g.118151  ORF Transcript_41086/g.118151 Transcript_41086/m.118151 type:complete len:315 (-) Transcript_41086:294-1238(-)
MLCVVKAALVLSVALPVEGQFRRSMVSLRGSSSSFVSSSTWFRGDDGQMHHHVEEEHSDTKSGDFGMRHMAEKVVCTDGHCHEETITMLPPGSWCGPGSLCPMRHRLNAMMGQVAGMISVRPSMLQPTMSSVPTWQGAPMPRPAEASPMPSSDTAAPPPRAALVASPSLRGLLWRIHGGASATPPVPTAPASAREAEDIFGATVAAPAMAACCVALASLLAAAKFCQGGTAVSAREPMLRSLGEPLAPIPEEVNSSTSCQAGAATAVGVPTAEESATAAARSLLRAVYTQAQAKVESEAVSEYLAVVYARAAKA